MMVHVAPKCSLIILTLIVKCISFIIFLLISNLKFASCLIFVSSRRVHAARKLVSIVVCLNVLQHVHSFFIKNKLNENIEAEIARKIRTILG